MSRGSAAAALVVDAGFIAKAACCGVVLDMVSTAASGSDACQGTMRGKHCRQLSLRVACQQALVLCKMLCQGLVAVRRR